MVPCLHQSNVYIKRKLQVWRVQKCIALVGAKSAFTCAVWQSTPSHVSQYGVEDGNLRKSGSTFRHGNVFAPKQCLHQKKATGMECSKMHCSSRCKLRTYVCRTANYPSHVIQYRVENRNLRKSGSTFRHGNVFARKQCLHQKKATGMECSKMHSSSRCKNRTCLCGTVNYPVTGNPV